MVVKQFKVVCMNPYHEFLNVGNTEGNCYSIFTKLFSSEKKAEKAIQIAFEGGHEEKLKIDSYNMYLTIIPVYSNI